MKDFVLFFSTLLAVVDPIAIIGPFLSMTASESISTRKNTAYRASFISFVLMVLVMLFGQKILDTLGITLPAFQIAGGILLFMVSIDMIYAKPHRSQHTREETEEGIQKDDVAVFPLAIPLISGPGTIASILMLSKNTQGILSYSILLLAILLVSILTLVVLLFSNQIFKLIGSIGINTTSRIMGIVLSALSVQFILTGIKAVF
ncbi:MAG: MarC family protein [Oligoflexia bacterium]|nr:MarC family protein [Oligoflexia bacterium]